MALTPLQRKALFKAAVALRQTTISSVVREFGVCYNHFTLVLKGERVGSSGLEQKIADFLGLSVDDVFKKRSSGKQYLSTAQSLAIPHLRRSH